MSAGLDASTVTPGSTAPLESRTTPAISAVCAELVAGRSRSITHAGSSTMPDDRRILITSSPDGTEDGAGCSLLAPCHQGATLRIIVKKYEGQDTSIRFRQCQRYSVPRALWASPRVQEIGSNPMIRVPLSVRPSAAPHARARDRDSAAVPPETRAPPGREPLLSGTPRRGSYGHRRCPARWRPGARTGVLPPSSGPDAQMPPRGC